MANSPTKRRRSRRKIQPERKTIRDCQDYQIIHNSLLPNGISFMVEVRKVLKTRECSLPLLLFHSYWNCNYLLILGMNSDKQCVIIRKMEGLNLQQSKRDYELQIRRIQWIKHKRVGNQLLESVRTPLSLRPFSMTCTSTRNFYNLFKKQRPEINPTYNSK